MPSRFCKTVLGFGILGANLEMAKARLGVSCDVTGARRRGCRMGLHTDEYVVT